MYDIFDGGSEVFVSRSGDCLMFPVLCWYVPCSWLPTCRPTGINLSLPRFGSRLKYWSGLDLPRYFPAFFKSSWPVFLRKTLVLLENIVKNSPITSQKSKYNEVLTDPEQEKVSKQRARRYWWLLHCGPRATSLKGKNHLIWR